MMLEAKMLGRDVGGGKMDASLLANTGCGGFCTQRVKGFKIGLQLVFQLYHLILYPA